MHYPLFKVASITLAFLANGNFSYVCISNKLTGVSDGPSSSKTPEYIAYL